MSASAQPRTLPRTVVPQGWFENSGHPPIFEPEYQEQLCPPHLFTDEEAGSARVHVRLRNGKEVNGTWPVLRGTRWTLNGDGYDIEFYRKA